MSLVAHSKPREPRTTARFTSSAALDAYCCLPMGLLEPASLVTAGKGREGGGGPLPPEGRASNGIVNTTAPRLREWR